MGRKKNIVLENIKITSAGAKGVGVGTTDEGKKVLVKGAVPGDEVNVGVKKARRHYFQGEVIDLVSPSPDRIEPQCGHFNLCGGCQWQNLNYEKQLKCKQQEVEENIKRLGGLSGFETLPIISSDEIFNYRNKMEFSFSNARWLTKEEINAEIDISDRNALGFHIPGMWSKVLNIENCHLQADPSNKIRNEIRHYSIEKGLDFFDLRKQEGLLRTLMIRISSIGEIMVLLQFYRNDKEEIKDLLSHLQSQFPEITSLLFAINPKGNDSVYDLNIQLYSGESFIKEKLGKYKFRIGPKSFFQTNTQQAEKLYELIKDFAHLQGDECVYDLYSGTGTIGIYLSALCEKVVGVESVQEAVDAAKVNADDNGVDNCTFYCGDMKKVLTADFFQQNGRPDVLIVDPPRDGMHKDVVAAINASEVERLVYVSCNSATQARDLEILSDQYDLIKIRPVDLFPQTHHVENVALLTKRKSDET